MDTLYYLGIGFGVALTPYNLLTAFCGTLIKAFGPDGKEIDSPNVGRKIVWDMVAYPDGLYDDGKIWSPDRDKTYSSDMTLSGDSLSVRGCVFGICRDGGTWTRVN